LIVFLPLEVLLDEPIGECFRVIRRCCCGHSQRQQNEKRGDVSDAIPSSLEDQRGDCRKEHCKRDPLFPVLDLG
jgi:hypothetical protein